MAGTRPPAARLSSTTNNISLHCSLFLLFVLSALSAVCWGMLGDSRGMKCLIGVQGSGRWWMQSDNWLELQEAPEVDWSRNRTTSLAVQWIVAVNYSTLPAGAGGRVMVVGVGGDLGAIEVTHLVEKTTKGSHYWNCLGHNLILLNLTNNNAWRSSILYTLQVS